MACSTPCVVHDDLTFYPPKLWGLNFHFMSYRQMYVADILQMKEYPHFTGAFCYKNHPVYKVDIIGTVVKKADYGKCFVYGVDDGTGVILCCCWKVSFHDQYNKMPVQACELPDVLSTRLQELENDTEKRSHGYDLGDLIWVKGKVKMFREKMEIVANFHSKVEDPNKQLVRMQELPGWYKQIYDKPFPFPLKVRQALLEGEVTASGDNKFQLVSELKDIIESCVSDNHNIVLLDLQDIKILTRVKEFIHKHCPAKECSEQQISGQSGDVMLTNALLKLQDEGHVIKRTDSHNLYEFLMHKSNLEEAIISLLKTEMKKKQYADRGCHYLHLLYVLQQTVPYYKLKQEAIIFCLDKLEAQSEVIRSTKSHYLPCP